MSETSHTLGVLRVRGIGAWASGMPSWDALCAVARGEATPAPDAPRKPAPELLAPNERRRAPDTVLLALEAGLAACRAADADPAMLSSIFASTHGELAITDAMCRTLVEAPTEISPTRFHNSVHNAASGYWTIGCGCRAASTAISAYRATLAQGLIEAAMQLEAGEDAVLLVVYDGTASGPLASVSPSEGLFGLGLVLERAQPGDAALSLSLGDAEVATPAPRLAPVLGANAMASALGFVEWLARGTGTCVLEAGHGAGLRVEWRA
jgi:hypothetical protein